MTKHIGKLSTGCLKDITITSMTVPDLDSTTPETINVVSIPSVWMNDYDTTLGTSSKITFNPITITYPSITTTTTTWNPTTSAATSTSEIFWPARVTNTDGESYINLPAYMCDSIDYDEIIEIKDPNKEGVFVVGALYKACKGVPYIYFDVECEELFASRAMVLCLGSELLPCGIPLYKEKVVNGIRYTKNVNRVWITKFLLKEKIISYSWYENAEILSRQMNVIPFGAANWFEMVAPATYRKNGKQKSRSRKAAK